MRIGKNSKQMGTHIPTLMKAVFATTGDVCEVGSGFNSTPLLHWITQGRKLVTYENDPDYLHFARKFRTYNHRVRGMEEIDFEHRWSVVFIDHACVSPRTRGDDAIRFVNADLIVLHDTEPENEVSYGYDKVWPRFKYRYDWKECKPYTSVVSNTIDVSKWNSLS